MGKFIWHQWARYVSIFACVYAIWSGFWGIFFRKFFWDFVGGKHVKDPLRAGFKCGTNIACGIIPSSSAQIFITIIVRVPVIQILAILFGIILLCIETVPYLRKTMIHRSFVFKLVWLILQALLCFLFYQGTNGGVYSVTAAFGYAMALVKDEVMKEAKDNRGRGGKA
jgi:vacuolar-type H+-ATPase subunit I/STV1